MSYYCKGEICPHSKKCARVMAWELFTKNGSTDGVWFVPESTCINNNYEDGIFQTKITIKQITELWKRKYT